MILCGTKFRMLPAKFIVPSRLLTWCASTFHKRTTHNMFWPSPTGRTSYTPQPGIRPETQYIDYKEKTEWDVGQSCLTWYSPQDSVHICKRTFDKWRPRFSYIYKVICLMARAHTWLYQNLICIWSEKLVVTKRFGTWCWQALKQRKLCN